MFYVKAFINSLYNFSWIKNQKDDFKKSTNYFIIFIFLLSFFYASHITFISVPKIQKTLDPILEKYKDISLEVKEDKINISGIEEPLELKIIDKNSDTNLFIYIDTTSSSDYLFYSKNDVNEDRLIINSSSIALYGKKGERYIQSAEKFSDFKINKNFIDSFFSNSKNILIFSLLSYFVIFTFVKFINLLFLSSLFYFIYKIRKKKSFNFKQILAMGFYLITGPSLFVAILAIFNYNLAFLYTFLVFLNMYLVFEEQKNSN